MILKKKSMIDSFNGVKNMQNYFCINTKYLWNYKIYHSDNAKCGVKLNNSPLYLGIEKDNFIPEKKRIIKKYCIYRKFDKKKKY